MASLDQLGIALKNAQAAGDTYAATKLSNEINRLRQEQGIPVPGMGGEGINAKGGRVGSGQGMFDDLIPAGGASGGISFDDLIPKKSGQHFTYEQGLALMAAEERLKQAEAGGQRGRRKIMIDGRKVEVDDGFFDLSPEEQDATVDEIAAQMDAGATSSEAGDYPAGATLEQKRAIAMARARRRRFEQDQLAGDQRERMQGASGTVGAALASTIDGIPVAGPYIKAGTERAAAGLSSLINGRSYEDNLSQAQDLTRMAQEEHPYVTTAGNIAGAVGGTLPAVAAAPWAFGGGSAGLGMRMLASMTSGAGLSAADSGVRNDWDTDAMKWAALWGGGTGLAGPAVGDMLGKGVQSVADALRRRAAAKAAGTTPYALEMLQQAATRDGIDPAAMRSMLDDLGPDAMIGDLGPNLQGRMAALANLPGEGNATVRRALDARHAGANSRLASTIDDTLGRAVAPSSIDDAIVQGQRVIGERYRDAFRSARAVDTRRIADGLESQAVNLRGDAQTAMKKVRSMLNITGTDALDPNPGTLFQVRQAIDGMMETETNSKAIAALSEVRKQVDDLLADAVPGIKEIDGAYRELARQREALQRGQTALDTGRTAPWPSELAVEAAEGVIPEGAFIGPSGGTARMRQGTRADIARILGNNSNNVAKLNQLLKGEGSWNRERLATMFGEDKADQLFRVLDGELKYAQTREFAIGNSATAGRQESMRELGGGGDPSFGIREAWQSGGTLGGIRGAALKGVDKVFGKAAEARRAVKNADLADILASNRQAVVQALIDRQAGPRFSPGVEQVARALLLSGATSIGR